MRFFQKLIIASSVLFSAQTLAFTPESGFWWNPNEPGSGYSIEIQDNYLFVALYVYDAAGNPIWFTGGATLNGNSLFNSDLSYTYNGTCIDCNVTQPITITGSDGDVTINFVTETTGTIQFGGAVKNIERFNFLLGDEIEKMLGEWQTVIDFSSTEVEFPFNGDVLLFDITTNSAGEDYAEGCRPDNTIDGFCTDFALNNHEIAAVFDYQANQLLVVVNDSADYWLAYYLEVGLDQFDGVAELYGKNAGHNNIFYPVRGFRTASRSFLETGVGPSKKSHSDDRTVVGIADRVSVSNTVKSLSEFNQVEQAKIQRQQKIIEKLIESLDSK